MIGELIDAKYRILRLIREGGMGAEYEAEHTGTDRRVAIKFVSSAECARKDEIVTRFQLEARVVGTIDTQHIVQVLDTGCDSAWGHFLVMELLSGEDASELVEKLGPLPVETALRIGAQACIGLEKAHQAGVVHRDIKPANLFLARRDEGEVIVKILDFGIAKVRMDAAQREGGHKLTATGALLGSPLYMSPEQAQGLSTVDQRTDIWSLGAVLYEALTGRPPHQGITTLGRLIVAICGEPPSPVQEHAPWVPPEVAAIVHRALRLDPKERFPSAAAMLDAIHAVMPHGWGLTEAMLTALPAEQRSLSFPRYSGPPHAGARASGGGTAATVTAPGPAASTTGRLRSAAHADLGGTAAGVAAPASSAGKPTTELRLRPSKALIIAGFCAVGLFGLGVGIGAYPGTGGPAMPMNTEPFLAASQSTPTVLDTPPDPAVPPSPAPSTRMHTVKLIVVPADAKVEVDGVPTKADGGVVDIAGALGSIHPVRVSLGSRAAQGDVVITEQGARPSRMKLDIWPPKPRARTASSKKPSLPSSSPPAVPTTDISSQIDKDFK